MHKIAAVVGPTASGKSSLAIQIAKAFDGEIISADSMQVYQGMDIGTAKIRQEEMEGVPHYLIDILPPDRPWNVKTFQKLCRQAVDEIVSRGKLPILCGGTGLYVKAALYDYQFEDESEEISEEIRKKLDALSAGELYELLGRRDPASLEKIHPNNRKRLLRAAIMSYGSQTKSSREQAQTHQPVYDLFVIGLRAPREQEIERIDRRVDEMFEQGLVSEVQSLFSDPKSREWNSFQAIGYKEFGPWLNGEEDLETVKEKIKIHTRQYARRQMTWFGRQMPVRWYTPEQSDQALKDLEVWYGQHT